MGEISKPDYTYQWASGGAVVAPSNGKIQTGWTAEVPPFQWENWSQNRQDQAITHILQKGISVWSNTGEYYFTTSGERSYVQGSNGNVYVAVADSVGQNPVTDNTNTYWAIAFVTPTTLTTAQTLNGPHVGEFSNLKMSVTAPAATASMTADSVIVASALNGLTYKLTSVTKSINLAITGVGGMDTGLAPISGFVSLYLIYNPTTQASNLLACNQTTSSGVVYSGVNMPAGYTASALVGVWPTNASRLFPIASQVERQINIALTLMNSSTVNQTDTLLNISSVVPTIAKSISGIMQVGSSVQSNCRMSISGMVGSIGLRSVGGVVIAAGNHQGSYSDLDLVTNTTIYYSASTDTGALSSSAWVTSYKI